MSARAMTSRQRVEAALAFRPVDRLPQDLGGSTGASGIHVLAYARLRAALGLEERPIRCNDLMQQLAVIDDDARAALQLDVVQINGVTFARDWRPYPLYPETDIWLPAPVAPERDDADGAWRIRDAAGNVYRKPDSSFYFDAEDGVSWYGMCPPLTDEFLADLAEHTAALHRATEYALVANFGGGFFQPATPENLIEMIEEPETARRRLERKCDQLIATYSRLHGAVGDYTCCIVFADDFGSQDSTLLSPRLFADIIAPHYRRFADWLHRHTRWKFYLHTCGAIEPLLETIIGMGVDILNPIQTSARGMDPARLKQCYGDRLVFWGGGCDTQQMLGRAPTEELRRHVAERRALFGAGSGYVFNQIHAIQPNVRPEDILALFPPRAAAPVGGAA